jgi:threonine/homoserine/homoserine lactone efflux protein
MIHLLQGFLIGLALAAPVGPVGLLCIRRSIAEGRLAGFLTGLGAAFADGVFGLAAAFGLTMVTAFAGRHAAAFQLTGSAILLTMGLATLRARPAPRRTDSPETPPLCVTRFSRMFLSTFFVAISNPATITACLGIFTGFAADLRTAGPAQAFLLVLGIFLGSAAWWLILSSAASAFGRRLESGGLRFIDLSAGALVIAFGLWQLGRLAWNRS